MSRPACHFGPELCCCLPLSVLQHDPPCHRPAPPFPPGSIVYLALPIAASHFCGFALSLISVSFVGRLGQQEMAVAVLASSVMNVTGYSVVMGLLGACDTLCGQVHGGLGAGRGRGRGGAERLCISLAWPESSRPDRRRPCVCERCT